MSLVRKYDFKFYEILEMLNWYFTPDTTDFFDYCVNNLEKHSSFLRSCFCKRAVPLEDFDINYDMDCVLCAFNVPFEDSHFASKDKPKLKMQLVFDYKSKLDYGEELCKALGFPYMYVLNPHTNKITNLEYLK